MTEPDPSPARPLRSVHAPGSVRWATRRAQWRALGLTDADLEKPKIAVVNSSSDMAICFSHLDEIAARVKAGVRAAGGLAFEARTVAPSDFLHAAGHGGGYVLSSRDLIVADVEVAVEGARLDGMICLASCDKTTPAHLMAAARLDVPTIVVACGYQPAGRLRGEHCDIEDVFLHACGEPSPTLTAELTAMSDVAVGGPGVCAGMGTANSMHVVAEALGMALPGTTPVAARSDAMWAAVDAAAARIVAMVHEDLRPRTLITAAAVGNAVRVALAVGASINTVKHLQAVAVEAGLDLDVLDLFATAGADTPVLTDVRPNGPRSIEEFEAAGGAAAVLAELGERIDRTAATVSGATLAEDLAGVASRDRSVIRPATDPVVDGPLVLVLRGSLCPDGGIVKLAADAPVGTATRPDEFTGPARCADSQEEALALLAAGRLTAGDVVVLRGLGPHGRPGMGMASQIVFALDRAGLTGRVAVVTDGQLSGLVNRGVVVGEVRPEAADGGPLARVRDDDLVRIDLRARTCDVLVDPAELAARDPAPAADHAETGWLSVYRRTARPLQDGAVLRP